MVCDLDWCASIVPGKSMMGLSLGMDRMDVEASLDSCRIGTASVGNSPLVQFRNSPVLLMDIRPDGIILRDTHSRDPLSQQFDEAFTIGFDKGKLVYLMTSLIYGASIDYYRGQIFGEVGLGMPVASLQRFCSMEFDPGDELFYPEDDACKGLSVGGSSCSLEEDPSQVVSYIRVYM